MKVSFPVIEYESLFHIGELGSNLHRLVNNISELTEETEIFIPFYHDIALKELNIESLDIFDNRNYKNIFGYPVSFFYTKIDRIKIYLIKNDSLFSFRNNIYGYDDDVLRFILFSLSVVEVIKHSDKKPDILHLNDWHTAIIPLLLKKEKLDIKTVFTIHDISFQGITGASIFNRMGLKSYLFFKENLEFFGNINLLNGGINFSDQVVFNSQIYLDLIQDNISYSGGLSGLIKSLSDKILSVPLGIDDYYNPESDPKIKYNYSVKDISGKLRCKTELQKELDLPIHTEIPILVIPSSYASEDEILLLNSIIPYLIKMEIQIIIIGNRLVDFEKNIRQLSFRVNCTAVSLEDNDENRRKIFSGGDIFLDISINSSNEKNIKTAFKYGLIPIIFNEDKQINFDDTHFRLFNFTSDDLINTIKYTINKYYYLEKWNEKIRKVMIYDFSWNKTAENYRNIYQKLLGIN